MFELFYLAFFSYVVYVGAKWCIEDMIADRKKVNERF